MSRVLFFIAIFVYISYIQTALCSDINNTDQILVTQYLKQYGYLQEETEEQSSTVNNTLFNHAVSLFQQFYNLPGNGELNAKTRQLMSQPRCGVKDYSTKKFSSLRSKWPKTHLTWNFYLGDIKHVQLATKAFQYWSNVSSLTFERITWNPDIIISYKSGVHGFVDPRKTDLCSNPFDGPGNVLAHAYYPSGGKDFTSEIHLDYEESWFIELRENPTDDLHLIHILVHEIGHALGLDHSARNNSVMYAYALNLPYPPKLSMEDIHRIRGLYGINTWKSPTSTLITPTSTFATPTVTSATVTPMTTAKTKNKYPDLCALRDIDALIVINHKLYITHNQYLWTASLDGKVFSKPLLLTDYMPFLPITFTRFTAAYQKPSGELILFTHNLVYMVNYPSITLVSDWPKSYKDIGIPENAKINGAFATNTGRAFILYNDRIVAEIDNCNTAVKKYESTNVIFPGVPPGISMVFRYIDGNLYFIGNHRYVRFNEFENTVTSTGNFDLSLVNIICPRKGILHQLRDLLARLTRLEDTNNDNDENN